MQNNIHGTIKPDYKSEEYKAAKDYNKIDPYKVDEFTRAYMECALWSSTATVKDDDGEDLDVNLDDNHDITDIAPETLGKMIADCATFQLENSAALKTCYADRYSEDSTGKEFKRDDYTASSAGHDFWLTRCGHGAGFWDRGLEEAGEVLSNAARKCGNLDLYIGDDGKIHS